MSDDDAPFVLLLPADLEAALNRDGGSFVEERRPGMKARRFLQLPDEDERRDRRKKATSAPPDDAYLERLDRARRTLLQDEKLRTVLPAQDPAAWPSTASIARAVDLRSVALGAAQSEELMRALRVLEAECRLPGLYPLVAKTLDETESFAGLRAYGTCQGESGGTVLQQVVDSSGSRVVATDLLELDRPPVPEYTVDAVLALPLSAAMLQELVPAVLKNATPAEWKRAVCDRHAAALVAGRPGALFGVADMLATFPFLKPSALSRSLSAEQTSRSRFRSGLFVTVLPAEEFFVLYEEPKVVGAKMSLAKLRQLPTLTAEESSAFIALTGSTTFGTASTEQLRIVLSTSTTERAENAVLRVASATAGEPAAGCVTHLSERLWVQRVTVPGNRYLVVHGHRCQQQLEVDEQLLLQLEAEALGTSFTSQIKNDSLTSGTQDTVGRAAGSSLAPSALVVAQELEDAVVEQLSLRARKIDEVVGSQAVLQIFGGNRNAAKREVTKVLQKVALLNSDRTYCLK